MDKELVVQAKQYIDRHNRRRRWRKVLAVLAIIVVVATSYSLMKPAQTVSHQAYCGYDEHTEHTDECYSETKTLICDLPEEGHTHTDECYQDEQVLVCELEENEEHTHTDECYTTVQTVICGLEECEGHEHTDECYEVQREFVCKKPIHEHTLQCFSNPRADIETTTEWENTINRAELSSVWGRDILAVAETQMGYSESTANYKVQEDGTTMKGYTRYGDWYGDPYGDWCAMFCSFCMHYAGVDEDLIPQESNCEKWIDKLSDIGLYQKASAYTAKPGDLIFFDWNENGEADHVGFVVEVADGKVYTIEGNKSDCVRKDNYDIDDSTILGYGVMPQNPEQVEGSDPDGAGGYVWVVQEENTAKKKLLKGAAKSAPLGAGAGSGSTGLAVEDYIPADGATLEYRLKENEGLDMWVSAGEPPYDGVPGDADLRLNINFANVNVDQLLAAGRVMTLDLPDVMRYPIVDSRLMAGNEVAGSITTDGETVTLTFDEEWLNRQRVNADSKISGKFWVISDIDLSWVSEHHDGGVVVGDIEINVDFSEDIIEQYGEVNVSKTEPTLAQGTDGHWYLTYSVKVKAGVDGCPDVHIEDEFVDDTYIDDYVVSSLPNGTTYTVNNGKLSWNIGTMAPNEEKTITYKVRLDDDYIGGSSKGSLDNTAQVFSKNYPKQSTVVNYEPKATVQVNKVKDNSNSHIQTAEDGTSYYIYKVTITAPLENEYPLNDVVIMDAMDGSLGGGSPTDPEILQWLSYDPSYWRLSSASASNVDVSSGVNFTNDTNHDNKANEGYSVNIGTLQPGQSVTLSYKVNVDQGMFPTVGDSSSIKINNTAGAALDGDGEPDVTKNVGTTVNHKEWARKSAGERMSGDNTITIPSGDAVYIPNGSEMDDAPNPGSFTVPAGSYLYQCVANEAGDWDISSASLTDTLDKAWMKYQGYVRVDAYEIDKGAPVPGDSDAKVIANLMAREPDKTAWVDVDDETGFSFSPKQIGLGGEYAYLLTYYAMPESDETIANTYVSNTFGVTGDVGVEGNTFELVGVEETKKINVETDTSFNAEKEPWYYANVYEEQLTNFPNGAAYWIIKANGCITDGIQMRDNAGQYVIASYFRTNSIVGVYRGNLNGGSITDYEDVNAIDTLVANGTLVPVTSGYSITYYNNYNLTTEIATNRLNSGYNAGTALITFTEDINLASDETLYFVFRTAPRQMASVASTSYYYNKLSVREPGATDWSPEQEVHITTSHNEYLFKLGYIAEYDGEEMTGQLSRTISDSGVYPKVTTEAAQSAVTVTNGKLEEIEPGTYINWFLRLDQLRNMDGRYRIIDTVPAGLSPEFVNVYTTIKNTDIHSVQIAPADLPADGTWTEHVTTMLGYNGDMKTTKSYTVYWYTDENNRVLMDFDGFDSDVSNARGLQLFVGTRVVDEDVLFRNEMADFNNTADLYDSDGDLHDSSSSLISVDKETITKKSAWNESMANTYPFIIEANPLGEDLLVTKDHLTIVDTMSDNLTFVPSSVVVKNTKTDEIITDWSVSVDGQTFSITVPDNVPLTITYNATVSVSAGVHTELWNKAHWEGVENPYDATVEIDDFHYDAGGEVTSDTPPSIEITKNDKNHAENTLPGAHFELQEMQVITGGAVIVNENGAHLTGITGDDGTLVFASEDDAPLLPNVVYRIRETEAPENFEVDPEDHYFIVAKKVDPDNDGVKEYPSFLNTLPGSVKVQYWENSPRYSINIYDAPIEYALPMTGGDGVVSVYALGIMLTACALVYGFGSRRKRERRTD